MCTGAQTYDFKLLRIRDLLVATMSTNLADAEAMAGGLIGKLVITGEMESQNRLTRVNQVITQTQSQSMRHLQGTIFPTEKTFQNFFYDFSGTRIFFKCTLLGRIDHKLTIKKNDGIN